MYEKEEKVSISLSRTDLCQYTSNHCIHSHSSIYHCLRISIPYHEYGNNKGSEGKGGYRGKSVNLIETSRLSHHSSSIHIWLRCTICQLRFHQRNDKRTPDLDLQSSISDLVHYPSMWMVLPEIQILLTWPSIP